MHTISDKTLGRIFLGIGFVGLVVGCRMSYKFGMNMSGEHAIALVLVTLFTAFAFAAYEFMRAQGFKVAGFIVAALGVFFFGLELFSHVGYTIGQRHENVTLAQVQHARFDRAKQAEEEEKAAYDIMQKRFAELTQQNGWAATVTADALRAKLPSLNLAIEQEASRGGCKSKCLAATKERDEISARIAILEERTALQTKLEAARTYLDKRREKADTTDVGSSSVQEQTAFVAKIWTGSLSPDAVSMTWTQYVIGLMLALGAALMHPAAFWMAYKISIDKARSLRPANTNSPAVANTTHIIRDTSTNQHLADLARIIKGAKAA